MTRLFLPYQKATLLIPSGPARDPDRMHLFIIITDSVSEKRQNLLVSVSSLSGKYCDRTCILTSRDHKFIRHDSYVNYAKARIEKSETLTNGVRSGVFEAKGPIEQAVLNRIIEGLLRSPRTPYKIKEFCSKYT